MFSRITTFLHGKPKIHSPPLASSVTKQLSKTTHEKSSNLKMANFEKKKMLCKVFFLDNTEQLFKIDKDSVAEELMNQVVRTLDLAERDYFSLQYEFGNQMFWLDMTKPIRSQVKKNFNFYFKVKFFPPDPDELVEELTRYHFYLQARKDVKERKLSPPYHITVELAALALQSELGDYEDLQHDSNYVKDYKFIPKQTEQFEKLVSHKHQGLLSMTPGECEMNYLRIIKNIHGFGFHKFSVANILGLQHELCVGSKGVVISRNNLDLENYFWEQLVLIAFKRKIIKFKVQNRNNKKRKKIMLVTDNSIIAKDVWKLCIEYHSFFRLLKSVKKEKKSIFSLSGQASHIYHGRTLYESMKVARNSIRRKSFRRKPNNSIMNDRITSGYLRLGSRVLSKGYNGEYYHGNIVALSDKIYVKNDNGNTAAFSRDVDDAIIFDADPDPSEVQIGTRVIARWPGIDSYLPGTVENIEGQANFRRYWILFDDEDHHWNNIDQIRLLKPPLYFGPGSNFNKSFRLQDKSTNKQEVDKPLSNNAISSTPITADKSNGNTNFNTSYSSIDVANNKPSSLLMKPSNSNQVREKSQSELNLSNPQKEGTSSSSLIDIGITQGTIL